MLDDKLKLVGHSGCGRVLSLAEESPHPKVVGYTARVHFTGSRFVMKSATRLAAGGSMFANTAIT